MVNQAVIKEKFERLRPVMDERMSRLWAANEATGLGFSGEVAVSAATGLSRARIRAGAKELQRLTANPEFVTPHQQLRCTPSIVGQRYRIRRPGGGRKLTEAKQPGIMAALERLLADEEAGDPMGEQRWIRSSLRRLSECLKEEGYQASTGVVSRLLKNLGFSLKANKRKQGRPGCPERDAQFRYIASLRKKFIAAGLPVISVDTKKKELIGEFRNNGRTWRREPEEVHEHDFPGGAECRAVPFGIYDVERNEGYVYVGVSNDTPEFAVNSIARWWNDQGKQLYPAASKMLVLSDGGGCNGCRARAWKLNVQTNICDKFGIIVTVCHYPTGCSKWNPVEHRLFSYISKNWEGKPLKTLGIMLGYIRGTTTRTGLLVKAFLDESVYKRGQKVTREDVERLKLTEHEICPQWNYTLRPRGRSRRTGIWSRKSRGRSPDGTE
jgi:hypothetical protein